MSEKEVQVVTGAFGYLGQYITRLLLAKGVTIRTLTGHPKRPNPYRNQVEVVPFHFDDPYKLVSDLKGAKTVYNTYWVRFNHGSITYSKAVANVQNLIRASAEAGVKRFVHVSITNPSLDSPSGYFKGKAIMEKTLVESGLSYAIIRPTVLFGREDILINNIAWLLKKFPVFLVFGDGEYRIQPVYVGDVAKLAVQLGVKSKNIICDAVGPETFTFMQLVDLIRRRVGSRAQILRVPPRIGLLLAEPLNLLVRDIITNREEVYELMAEPLVSYKPPLCSTRFSKWTEEHSADLGTKYASELNRHYRKSAANKPIVSFGE